MISKPDHVREVWTGRAAELATWAARQLVNRRDAWGAYATNPDGSASTWTAPAVKCRGRVLLLLDHLARHFRAAERRDIIGLHSTSPSGSCLWGALDIDQHGNDPSKAAANEAAAMAWYAELTRRGLAPLLTTSNGVGGYHQRLLLAEPVPAFRVFALLKDLSADHQQHGLTAPPETFPKQAVLPPGKYGNWLRLPGRHHTRDHWSRVWGGSRWLDGDQAIDHILAIVPAPAVLVPVVEPPSPPVQAPPRADAGPVHPAALERRIAGYMRRLPHLRAGECRHGVAYQAAAWLVRDMQLDDGQALAWLTRWDRGNAPPLGEVELTRQIADAHAYGTHPYGCGLASPPPRPRRGVTVIEASAVMEVRA